MTSRSSGKILNDVDRLRLRHTIRQWFVPIIGLLLVTAAVGAGTVYATYVEPGETTEEHVVSTWSETADFSHSATVQRDTSAFREGTELRNRPVYYSQVSPDVNVEYSTGYVASDSGSLDIETTLELLWQNTDADENVLWEVAEPIAASEWSDVKPGETKQITTGFNATEVNARIEAIEGEIGSSRGSAEAILVARTIRSGTVNDESIQQSQIHTLQLDHQGTTYGFLDPSIETNSYERTETETIPVAHGPFRSVGSIVLTVTPLLGVAILAGGRFKRIFELSPTEEAQLNHALAREEYDEWITPGILPECTLGQSSVDVASLKGIVNVAIDSNRRVIEDGNRYVLTTPELTYSYVNDNSGRSQPPTPAGHRDHNWEVGAVGCETLEETSSDKNGNKTDNQSVTLIPDTSDETTGVESDTRVGSEDTDSHTESESDPDEER